MERKIQTDFDVNIFTDGSKTDLGTGAGVCINFPNNIPLIEDVKDYQILGKTASIFQAEMPMQSLFQSFIGPERHFHVDSQEAIHASKANLTVYNIEMNCKHTLFKLRLGGLSA